MHNFSISITTSAWAFKDYLCCVMYDHWDREMDMNTVRDTLPSCAACPALVGTPRGQGNVFNK